MRQPLTPLALATIAGILVANFTQPSFLLLLATGCFAIFALAFYPPQRPLALLLLTATTAALRFLDLYVLPPHHDLRNTVPNVPAIVSVRGVLATSPIQHRSQRKDSSHVHSTAFIDLVELRHSDHWIPCSGRVHATLPGILPPQFFRSQHIELEGVLQPPNSPEAPGLFNHAEYLRLNDVHRQLATDGPQDWKLAPNARPEPPVSDRFLSWSRHVLARGLPNPNPSLELIWAMTLGWHPTATQEFEDSFLQSGTIHVFAISGLHIALICMVFVALLRVLRLNRALCGLVALPAAWAYVAITGFQPSAIRSALMMSVVIGGWALERPGALLNSLAGACLCVLAWQPGQLFLSGFQLSFGVVGSMAVLSPPLHHLWELWTSPDPLLPKELRTPLWHRGRQLVEWLGLNLSSSTAAWLGSGPLVWQYFHLFNPISLAANLMVIPLSSAALVAALTSLLCGDWLPQLGEVFNASAWVWMTAMIHCSTAFAAIPAGWCHVAPIPFPLWVIYYGILFWIPNAGRFSRAWRRIQFSCCLAWILAVGIWITREDSKTRLVLLPGGGALWMDLPGTDNDGLINGGDESTARRITIPFLQAHGIDQLGHWFVTQAQVQHVGGAPRIHEAFHPQSIAALESLKTTLQPRGRSRLGPIDTARIQWYPPGSKKLGWTVQHPPIPHGFRGFDDSSGVLLGDFEGVRILFCGNLGRRGQRTLVERFGNALRADIAISGVPNEGEPLLDPLLEAVQPDIILLQNARYPVGRRGKPETFERLRRGGYHWMALGEAGTLTIEASGGDYTVTAYSTGEKWTGKGSAGVRGRISEDTTTKAAP